MGVALRAALHLNDAWTDGTAPGRAHSQQRVSKVLVARQLRCGPLDGVLQRFQPRSNGWSRRSVEFSLGTTASGSDRAERLNATECPRLFPRRSFGWWRTLASILGYASCATHCPLWSVDHGLTWSGKGGRAPPVSNKSRSPFVTPAARRRRASRSNRTRCTDSPATHTGRASPCGRSAHARPASTMGEGGAVG